MTTERVGQLVRGCPSLTKVSCSSLGHAAALKLGWESFAALVVLPGSNPDLVGAPVVPDTGWFNQKKKKKKKDDGLWLVFTLFSIALELSKLFPNYAF